MRGKGSKRKQPKRPIGGPPTEAREALERRWFSRTVRRPDLAALVTGTALVDEPLHRWLVYRQAFAPELVRLFLDESALPDVESAGPLLDPFAGVGTMPIECGRRGVEAIGVEALASLVYVADAKAAQEPPPSLDMASFRQAAAWTDIAERLEHPLHRAALICAVAAQHRGDGTPLADAAPIATLFADVLAMMQHDLQTPVSHPPRFVRGDARELKRIETASIAGVFTSPPYLSRHDYAKSTTPLEQVYRHWRPGRDITQRRDDQIRANPRSYGRDWSQTPHPAVEECGEVLRMTGQPKLAGVVRSYFEDMTQVLSEMRRVLTPGGPCWLVVGGARMKGLYVPTDTILAHIAGDFDFDVEGIWEARQLISSGRKLGTLMNVAPRESIVMMRAR